MATLASILLGWLVNGTPGTPAKGTALNGGMQTAGDIGYEHAQIGDEYWAALPMTWNVSDHKVHITRAEFGHVPQGLKVLEYRAVSAKETDGNVLLAGTDGKDGMIDLSKVHDYADQGITVKAKSGADYYYIARIKVTGAIDESLKDCRYWYEQDSEHYLQQIDCSTIIRLGPPTVYDDE
ncbi:hypothetical protein ACIHJG_40240 [Streptomyces sp. NPDC052415]|uniref:hypothetical protein n=1 Tax=Streptomyces sp. NPDC052415 TaxID=3365690 RepID=UPI0037D75693